MSVVVFQYDWVSQYPVGVVPGPGVGVGARVDGDECVGEGASVSVDVRVGVGPDPGAAAGRKSLNIWCNLSAISPLPSIVSRSIRSMRSES
jgi:hypothetical protein